MSDRARVAVLGGGMAGLAAAFELTATPELRKRYEVTVFTAGWRLGGKGASSRNPALGNRIEEHGLHVWFGFYYNAFDLIRRTYAELRPHERVRDHFEPCEEIVLGEQWKGRWVLRAFHPPLKDGEPGVGDDTFEFWDAAETMIEWLLGLWAETLRRRAWDHTPASRLWGGLRPALRSIPLGPGRIRRDISAAATGTTRELSALLATLMGRGARAGPFQAIGDQILRDLVARLLLGGGDLTQVLEVARQLSARRAANERPLGDQAHTPVLRDLLVLFRTWLWETVVEPALDDDDLRYLFYAVDTVTAVLSGIVAEDLAEKGFGAINDRDLRAWLEEHGADPLTTEHAPFIHGLYDLVFAFRDGDPSRPDLAAGKAVQALIRLACGYKGALVYKLRAGMGETVFAPLYEVLRRRGVRFRFFHRVTRLGVDAERRLVTRIELQPQVRLRATEYAPLIDGAWPSEPLWGQIAMGSKLRGQDLDLQDGEAPNAPASFALEHGRDEDGFEHVVLAIPPASLPTVSEEVAAAVPRFRQMLAHSHTVATQALQVWLTRRIRDMGWEFDKNSVLAAYAEPLSTCATMGHLRASEPGLHDAGVRDIAYFCGVLDERRSSLEDARAAARAQALAFLGRGIATGSNRSGDGADFDWKLLADPLGGQAEERFERQYWRANRRGSERYVTTYAGTVEHRLAPGDSGLQNLMLAGDWTRNGIDGGCMEAAVAAGRLAARAISGEPSIVPGTTGWLVEDGWGAAPPTYVDYGGLTTIPSPFRSENATLHGFWARADYAKLRALCERVFATPSGGGHDFRPIADMVMLTWGRIESVRSLDPAFEGWGSVGEDQVAIWVPVVRVHEPVPGVPVADSFAMFVPYIWLDNPMSFSTGREVIGYAKTWGVPGFPADDDASASFTLEAFGLARKGDRAGPHPLLEVAPELSVPAGGAPLRSLHDVAWHAAGELLGAGAELPGLGLSLPGRLLADVARSRLRSVFLKQVRAVEGVSSASLQQITETSYVVRRLRAWPLGGTYRLTVHPMFSQPLGDELGLESQRLRLAYRCEMDFDVRDSRVLWPR